MARTRANKQSKAPPGAADPGNMMSLAGTPMYMAPEVIRSEKRGRLGSPDIWSMGCVLLEVATG
jgi:mitogen-activated protein kinase kinase kinase